MFVELEAFAIDEITLNNYAAFSGLRRILACARGKSGTEGEDNCAEIYENRVGPHIGGLVLDPEEGWVFKLYGLSKAAQHACLMLLYLTIYCLPFHLTALVPKSELLTHNTK